MNCEIDFLFMKVQVIELVQSISVVMTTHYVVVDDSLRHSRGDSKDTIYFVTLAVLTAVNYSGVVTSQLATV